MCLCVCNCYKLKNRPTKPQCVKNRKQQMCKANSYCLFYNHTHVHTYLHKYTHIFVYIHI